MPDRRPPDTGRPRSPVMADAMPSRDAHTGDSSAPDGECEPPHTPKGRRSAHTVQFSAQALDGASILRVIPLAPTGAVGLSSHRCHGDPFKSTPTTVVGPADRRAGLPVLRPCTLAGMSEK